ncbi:MAG: hypothetical protein QXI39_06375 [Candidatus Bathyarchaeia archaeon]
MPKTRVMPEREGVGFEKHHKYDLECDFECNFLRYFLVPKKGKKGFWLLHGDFSVLLRK